MYAYNYHKLNRATCHLEQIREPFRIPSMVCVCVCVCTFIYVKKTFSSNFFLFSMLKFHIFAHLWHVFTFIYVKNCTGKVLGLK